MPATRQLRSGDVVAATPAQGRKRRRAVAEGQSGGVEHVIVQSVSGVLDNRHQVRTGRYSRYDVRFTDGTWATTPSTAEWICLRSPARERELQRRYAQCTTDCTTDCGACKGAPIPTS